MLINNSSFPPLTSGTPTNPINLPVSSTPPPPLTDAQKEALQLLRDKLKESTNPPVTVTPPKTSLIDEVV
ncbi:hypothetical protein ALQ04_02826 [Pseudomonas cichorii]|uniref:Uncharacterized protein n=1 Tax=Pseudomonas cichorii TaxID=36746 RepID=A0A3M4LNX9_PSECI|nr:hypothetical protein [Pseudomonas cichorii]RMQ43195.1 hypothetical protein ALQ04_02826 [Pseudomonas cichorii]